MTATHDAAMAPRPLADWPVREFVEQLASEAPTPGGGAAAAMVGATAASLVSMVAELSSGRPKLAPYAATTRRSAAVGRRLGVELLRLADEDAVAFGRFMDVWRSSKSMEPAQRMEAMSAAATVSAEVPRSILGCCVVIAEAGERLAGRSNPNLASDLMCASRAVEAAAHCAAENVLVNLPNFADRAEAGTLRAETRRMVADVERLARATRRTIARGGHRRPERPKADDIDESGADPA